MADEAGVAVFGGVFVHVDGVDVCSEVCFVDDCGDLGHAFGVVDVAEAMPQDDGEGGRGFGLFEEDFLLREGEGERKQTEEKREEHNNDCAVLTSKFGTAKGADIGTNILNQLQQCPAPVLYFTTLLCQIV